MKNTPTKMDIRKNINLLFENAPDMPISEKPVEVCIVALRCVYLNDYRIAGNKPYISENLPNHIMTTSLGEVLNAFNENDIITALAERKARQEYFAAYHAQPDEGDEA